MVKNEIIKRRNKETTGKRREEGKFKVRHLLFPLGKAISVPLPGGAVISPKGSCQGVPGAFRLAPGVPIWAHHVRGTGLTAAENTKASEVALSPRIGGQATAGEQAGHTPTARPPKHNWFGFAVLVCTSLWNVTSSNNVPVGLPL